MDRLHYVTIPSLTASWWLRPQANNLQITLLIIGLGSAYEISYQFLKSYLKNNEIASRGYRFFCSIYATISVWSVLLAGQLALLYLNVFSLIGHSLVIFEANQFVWILIVTLLVIGIFDGSFLAAFIVTGKVQKWFVPPSNTLDGAVDYRR